MRNVLMVAAGGILVISAAVLWTVLSRRNGSAVVSWLGQKISRPDRTPTPSALRWQLTGCAALAIIGLYVAAVHGVGVSSPARSGITAELGFAMMFLAVVWFLFSEEMVRFQVRAAAALLGLRGPVDPGQVRAATKVGLFIRVLLFLLGLAIVLVRLLLR